MLVAAASTAALSANADVTWKFNNDWQKIGIAAQRSAGTVADFNGDDRLDFYYSGNAWNKYYDHPGIWPYQTSSNMMLNNGDGTFEESVIKVEPTGEWTPDDNGEVRYDGDGNPIVDDDGNPIKFKEIYRLAGSDHGIIPMCHPHIATFDYNNDGLLDILMMGVTGGDDYAGLHNLVPSQGKHPINDEQNQWALTVLYKNIGNGKFQVVEDCNLPVIIADSNNGWSSYMRTIAWGDYDHDGYVDLAFSGVLKDSQHEPGEPGRVAQLWRNIDGTGRFEQMNIANTWGGTWTNEVKHTEGEGDDAHEVIDVPSHELEGWFLLLTGNVTMADINNDGWLDLIFDGWCDKTNDKVYEAGSMGRVYLNKEGKSFEDITDRTGQFLCTRSGSSQLADFDGDGYLDFLNAGYGDHGLGWKTLLYYNTGEAPYFESFEEPQGLGAPEKERLTARDFDGDGLLDVLYDGWSDNRVWYQDAGSTFHTTNQGLPMRGNDGNDAISTVGDLTGNGLCDRFETGWQWVSDNWEDGVNYRELIGASGDWNITHYLFTNETEVEVAAPEAPTGVKGSIDADTHMITVEWTDIEDLTCAYNVVVVSPSGKVISNLPVNPETGFVKVSENKNIAVRPFIQKYSIPAKETGDYKVGVQAVSLYNEKNSPIVWYDKVLSGVRDIFTDNTTNLKVSVNGNDITVNTSATTDVKIVDMMGRTVATGVTNAPINVAANGVFIITANGKSVKVVK